MRGDPHVRFCVGLGGKFPGSTRQNDNPLYETRSHQSGKGWVYGYDKANRLVTALDQCDDPAAEVATPSSEAYVQSLAYNMDDVFNLTSYVVTPYGGSASTTNFTVNAMNEYTAVGGVTHLYHDNGSLKDDGTYTYKYDAHDHLVEVRLKSNGSLVAEYFYDAVGRGRRTKKVVGNDTTRFVYHNLHCVEEYDGSDDLLRLFAFGDDIDQVVMMEAPDVADVNDNQNTSEVLRFHYHTQLVGSVTHVTGPGEGVVESYEYDPYGATTIKDQGGGTVSASPIGNPFMYTGRRLDEETGLYYYRARHYSPQLKRFVQRDPLEYVDGPNAYAYVRARPTVAMDPSGLNPAWLGPEWDYDPYGGYYEYPRPVSGSGGGADEPPPSAGGPTGPSGPTTGTRSGEGSSGVGEEDEPPGVPPDPYEDPNHDVQGRADAIAGILGGGSTGKDVLEYLRYTEAYELWLFMRRVAEAGDPPPTPSGDVDPPRTPSGGLKPGGKNVTELLDGLRRRAQEDGSGRALGMLEDIVIRIGELRRAAEGEPKRE
jgi:RHS repeat-associated protein